MNIFTFYFVNIQIIVPKNIVKQNSAGVTSQLELNTNKTVNTYQ